jgi:cation diffusion facilitator family transporter
LSVGLTKDWQAGKKVTWVGAGVNVLLIACKLVAGIWGRSQALIADAVHSISDFLSDAVVLIGLREASKAPDSDHHFGHARIETISSAIVGFLLIGAALALGYDAFCRIYTQKEIHPTWLALVGAGLSIVIKEALYQYTVIIGKKINSPAVIANAWHHRSDALSSWYFLDSLAALVVSILILKVGFEVLWCAYKEVTDAAPCADVVEDMRKYIVNVPGVLAQHELKVRSSGGLHQVQVHIIVDCNLTVAKGHAISRAVQQGLISNVKNVKEVIVHVDPSEQ